MTNFKMQGLNCYMLYELNYYFYDNKVLFNPNSIILHEKYEVSLIDNNLLNSIQLSQWYDWDRSLLMTKP